MNNFLKIQQKLIPQVVEIMTKRYSILRQIYLCETIGRRSLAGVLKLSERVIRSETEVLREQGLIKVETSGMTITEEGIELLEQLKDTMNEVMGLSTLEERLTQLLGIKKVILVPGDYEKNESILVDVARSAASYFTHIIQEDDIVSITGGTTMLEFSKGIKTDKKFENVTIVPARGRVGLDIEIQSNNIASDMSKRLHSKYELLNLPDKLGKESMMMLAQEPEIKRTLDLVSNSQDSILAMVAGFIAPIFKPLGFGDWRISTSLIAGFMAKESVVSTLSVLFKGTESLITILTPLGALSLLVFCLLYTPCVAAIASIRRELGGPWAVKIVIFQCVIAWICAFIVHTIGLLFI